MKFKTIIKMEKKAIVRPRNGKFFRAVDQRISEFFGKKVKDVYWLECDKDGTIGDGDKNGIIEQHTIHCVVPDGKEDIDISTLSEGCLD